MRKLFGAATVMWFGVALLAPMAMASEPADASVKAFVEAYDRAFNAKNMTRLALFYHPDVTVFEGGYVNIGWIDYRDNHLGPELKEMEDLRFSHSQVEPHVLSDTTAYVTAEYRLQTTIGGNPVDAEGLETLVLLKSAEGTWRIRHSHTSSRRKPPQPSGKP